MKTVFVDSLNIISPLGVSAFENYENVRNGNCGVALQNYSEIDSEPFWASLMDDDQLELALKNCDVEGFSRYEKLLTASVSDALHKSAVNPEADETLFIFSTTKGNISLLETAINSDVNLMKSAEKITTYFGNKNKPVVISNACISGVVALLFAKRILSEEKFQNVIITGADCINRFIYSGFLSFQALSDGLCRPFSDSRNGINLGEGAATIILSVNKNKNNDINVRVLEGAITNDANHISGPSRTGQELAVAIEKAIRLSDIDKNEIAFISAHGTATSFNDEMEAKAINLTGLQNTPVNSLKGYFGHTLGAAGLIESVISVMALSKNEIISTAGHQAPCVEPKVNVINNTTKVSGMKHFIKTASGFGGCNAALIFSKS